MDQQVQEVQDLLPAGKVPLSQRPNPIAAIAHHRPPRGLIESSPHRLRRRTYQTFGPPPGGRRSYPAGSSTRGPPAEPAEPIPSAAVFGRSDKGVPHQPGSPGPERHARPSTSGPRRPSPHRPALPARQTSPSHSVPRRQTSAQRRSRPMPGTALAGNPTSRSPYPILLDRPVPGIPRPVPPGRVPSSPSIGQIPLATTVMHPSRGRPALYRVGGV